MCDVRTSRAETGWVRLGGGMRESGTTGPCCNRMVVEVAAAREKSKLDTFTAAAGGGKQVAWEGQRGGHVEKAWAPCVC